MPFNKLTLSRDTSVLTRCAQSLDAELSKLLLLVCANNFAIRACYILEAQKPGDNDIKFLVAVSLENEAQELDEVAGQFQGALRQFPTFAEKVFIMSANQSLFSEYQGQEFYRRNIVGVDNGLSE